MSKILHASLHIPRKFQLVTCLIFLFIFASVPLFPTTSAQTQFVTVTPGNVNLGMRSTITVTAPAAGTYTVIVQKPSGTELQVNEVFTAAGQSQNATFGNATAGFKGIVDQVGTYNVFLQQNGQTIAATSFYATNKLIISTTVIEGGPCVFIAGGQRGENMLLQIHVIYASNGAPMTNASAGWKVTYTLPDGTVAKAGYHASSAKTWPVPWFQGHVWPSWNSTWVGTYAPSVNASDAAGNAGTFHVTGYPFVITPAQLNTNIQLYDTKTGKQISTLSNNQTVNVSANVQYLLAVGAIGGFNGPLDSVTKGGVVTAMVGWGFFNTTSNTFGSAKQPGALIATVQLTYANATKLWSGNFSTNTLPTLVNATAYEVIVASHDKASPPNTGLATLNLAPATSQITTTGTVSTATSISTTTEATVSVAVSTINHTVTTVPMWSYSAMVYTVMGLLLIIGLTVGFQLRKSE